MNKLYYKAASFLMKGTQHFRLGYNCQENKRSREDSKNGEYKKQIHCFQTEI